MKKYFKYKFENMNKWISAILSVILLVSIICPVIANYYTNDRSSSTVSVNNNSQQQKEIQKETFKDIKQNDLSNIIDSDEFISNITNPSETYATHFSEVSTSSNEIAKLNPGKKITDFKEFNVKDFKNEVMDNSKKIVAGDLLIDDLKNKVSEALKDNESLEKNIPSSLKEFLSNQPSDNYENINTEQKSNMFYSAKATSEKMQSSSYQIENADLKFFSKLDDIIWHFSNYASYLNISALATIALTVVAWGVAAYYWAATWFMLGVNIPFAIAATTQAAALTYSSVLSKNNYNTMKSHVTLLQNLRNTFDSTQISYIQNIHIRDFLVDLIMGDLSSTGIAYAIENGAKVFLKSIGNNVTNVFDYLQFASTKIDDFMKLIFPHKLTILGTSWSSPIGSIISIIDNVISIAGIVGSCILSIISMCILG